MAAYEFVWKEEVSTHSRPKAADQQPEEQPNQEAVSTHSRPKAAGVGGGRTIGSNWFQHTAARRRLQLVAGGNAAADCFNTQPPEGG